MLELSALPFEIRQLIRCFIAEAIATAFLIVLAASGMQTTEQASDAVQLGLAITVVSMVTARSNGAFQNPCMTLASWAAGYEPSWQRTVILIISEFCGGLLAASLFHISPLQTAWNGPVGFTADYFLATIIASTMHVLIMLSLLSLNVSDGDPMYLYLLLPILLGISGILGFIITSRTVHFEACNSMNPAFSFAIAVAKLQWYNHWIDWVGPFSGAVIASVLHRFVFQPRTLTPTTSL